jgi:hypothetical protein
MCDDAIACAEVLISLGIHVGRDTGGTGICLSFRAGKMPVPPISPSTETTSVRTLRRSVL